MRALLWRAIESHLGRHLTPNQLACTLGDLAEDLEREDRLRGRPSGTFWLAREALSVSAAYRAQLRHERRLSGRSIMGASWIDDTRFAARRLMKRPGASLASVATLACAIAAGAVTWSLLSALLLDPLPVRSADRLFVVGSHSPASGAGPASEFEAYPFHQQIRESGVFGEVAATGTLSLLVHEPGRSVPRDRHVAFISHDFFEVLGVQAFAGREFSPADDRGSAPLTAVVSDRYWRSALGGRTDAIGRSFTVAGSPATIVGIAPRRFRGVELARVPDIYLPLVGVARLDPRQVPIPVNQLESWPWLKTIGRLKPESTPAQAQQHLNTMSVAGVSERTLELIPLTATVIPGIAREAMQQFASLLAAAVALLLLIGGLTAGVLLLVRTEARRDELAICLALGGTRLSLARGIIIEGALAALGAIAIAVPLSWWLFSILKAFQLPGAIQLELLDLRLDRTALLAIAGSGAASIQVMTLVAAAFGSAPPVRTVFQSRVSATPRVARRRTRSALVVVQVAVALVLVAGASQLIQSLVAVLSLNAGIDASRLVTGDVSLRAHGYSAERAGLFFDELRERLSHNPAVESVSLAEPRGAMPPGYIFPDGRRTQFPTTLRYRSVDERYFATVGLPIVAGRGFTPSDTMTAPRVAVVSESFGRLVADGANPIGRSMTDPYAETDVRIVGIVRDVIMNVAETEPLTVYYPMAQLERTLSLTLVVRVAHDPALAVREAVTATSAIDSRVTPGPLVTMRERLIQQMAPQRLGSVVLGAFGAIAVLLTLLGAYVLADAASTVRRREFGIRAVLGASRAALGGLVLAETLRLVGGGIILGLGLAWMGAGLIRSFMFQVEALEPRSLAGTASAILLLALVVSLRPALDATRVDLAQTLRDD